MKNLIIKCAVIILFVSLSSFTKKTSTGIVQLEITYVNNGMGGMASITNTDTNVTYYLSAIDTTDSIEVPYGNYVLNDASTNSCNSPLLQGVTTSTGNFDFQVDAYSPTFIIYASCY